MSFPMSSLLPANDDVTGSLSKVPFGQLLDEEDCRREKAALATALDPQGNGSAVHWENATSGDKGTLTPVGQAFSADTKICRDFIGTLKTTDLARSIQSTACAVSAGDWVVSEVKHHGRASL